MRAFPAGNPVHFGLFELDLKAGQLYKNGYKIRLPQQPVQVLSILLERAGEVVTREELRQRLWSPDVFVDFDHGLNKAIQKLREVLGDLADSPRYIETIPRVGYRFIAPVAGERAIASKPPEEEETAAEDSPAEEPGAGQRMPAHFPLLPGEWFRGWRPAMAGCAILLVLGGGWLAQRRLESQRQTRQIRSLAVLPLDNLSGDRQQDYFADGMTDELTTMLAKDSTLRIVSRTSAMQYKGAHRPLREIAQGLGVDGVVEGSVEQAGGEVHMTLQLIQGSSDTHVWAESYDRDTNDAVSLPDEAARAIARKTDSAVEGRKPPRYVSSEAQDAYLHGRYLWFAGWNDEAEKYFSKAVTLDPDYAQAWTGVADYYDAGMAAGNLDPRKARQPSEDAAKRAEELDDSLPQAHNSLCAAFFFGAWDLTRADQECARAIDLDPKFAEAYHLRAKVLLALNRPAEAIALQKRAMELDPFARPWGLAYIYLLTRQYDAAVTEARERLESDPHNTATLSILAAAYRCKGMDAEAAKAWEDSLIEAGDAASAERIRRAFARGGYAAALRWNVARLKRESLQHYVSPVELALQYAQLGERNETLNLLEEGYRQHSPQLLEEVRSDPAFDFLHGDARYRAVMKGTGLPPEG